MLKPEWRKVMKFNDWLTRFVLAVDSICVLGTAELREAWRNGKDADELAKENDALASEYADMYEDRAA